MSVIKEIGAYALRKGAYSPKFGEVSDEEWTEAAKEARRSSRAALWALQIALAFYAIVRLVREPPTLGHDLAMRIGGSRTMLDAYVKEDLAGLVQFFAHMYWQAILLLAAAKWRGDGVPRPVRWEEVHQDIQGVQELMTKDAARQLLPQLCQCEAFYFVDGLPADIKDTWCWTACDAPMAQYAQEDVVYPEES